MTFGGGKIVTYQDRRISDMGSVTTGLVVKRKQAEFAKDILKTYQMLTLKSFDQDGWLNTEELEIFESTEILDDKYLTQEGDVILRLSYPNTAIVIDRAHQGFLIPSLFAVIRLETSILLPEYLSIYLNSDKMKRFYAKSAIGSAIQIIKTSMVKDLILKVPSLQRQQRVVEINKLILKEKELLSRLIKEKAKLHNAIMNKLM